MDKISKLKKPGSETVWFEHLEKISTGPRKAKEYCQENGLTIHQYYYWRRKLHGLSKRVTKRTSARCRKFVSLETKRPTINTLIKIYLRNGVIIECNTLPDAEWLTGLIATQSKVAA